MPPALLGHVDAPVPGARLESRRVVVRGWHGWEGSPALAASGWRAVVEVPPPAGQQADFDAVVQVVVWAAAGTAPVPLPPIAIVLPGEALAQGDGTGDDLRDPSPAHPLVVIDLPAGDVAAREVVPISGWALVGSRIASRVEIVVNGVGMGRARLGLQRPDVAQRWSSLQASISGFEKLVDLSVLPDRVRWAHVAARAFDGGSRAPSTHPRTVPYGPNWSGRALMSTSRRKRPGRTEPHTTAASPSSRRFSPPAVMTPF